MRNKQKKAHFIGLCGKGMSGVARLLQESGWEVTGSDAGFYDPIKSYIEHCGLDCMTPHAKQNIPEDVDAIIIGRHAKLIPEHNEEVKHAFEHFADKIRSYPEILEDMTENTTNFVVTGSYGKSTITALLTWILISNKIDTSYMIGALPFNFEYTSHRGLSDYFVLEGDEYPASNWDNESKFSYYNASSLIFTSGEHDHVNVFPTIESYTAPYKKLFNTLTSDSIAVVAIDHPNVEEIIADSPARIVTYGLTEKCDYYPSDITFGEVTSFFITHKGENLGKIETTLLGRHNVENIIGSVAFVLEHKLLTFYEIKQSVRSFSGLGQRLDKKTDKSSLSIYEGFGSSYAKSKSAIDAIKLHFPEKELVVLFEPHTFSWRNRAQLGWYEDIFKDTKTTLIYSPPSHGASSHDQLSLEEIVIKARENHDDIRPVINHEEIFETLEDILNENSVLLILTSGSFDNGTTPVIHLCEHLFPKK